MTAANFVYKNEAAGVSSEVDCVLQVLAAARDLGNLQLKSVANYGSLHSLVSVTLGAVPHQQSAWPLARSVSVSRGQALESMMNNHQGHYGQYGIVRHSGTRKFQNPQFS